MNRYSTCTDAELTDLLRKGDGAAFAEIYQRYSPVLYRHAYNKLRDKEEVRDLIQELFINLWDRRQDIVLASSLSSYLYGAVRNRVINVFAHQKVEERYLASLVDFVEADQVTADQWVRERELRAQIERAVASLPRKMREVFELSRIEHLNHKEIAERLDISDQTVNKQVKNALRILRSKLGAFLFSFWGIF
ncbi:DNA-directed RNA polymerase sigma-70 factor [Parapedobacter defluvii]|uniref:DNA-directed RNA polymerase sigma-70 factor n=1 Tax=Parapedobacter defluvii TaxID=2045106 RepID=A0ABQ1N1E3_9SPHI|nr:RNA polymerase sigma-70 factor [Parapedobacter defluvii]RQP17053.1 MAG: RNA polymerase sigma-70 factor [Parapedobacter sp.]GGC48382.1 DNA-directed RNA polymerase sigma-70 factor [Parapedobacter defluvii]